MSEEPQIPDPLNAHDPDGGCNDCPQLAHSLDFGAYCGDTGTHLYGEHIRRAPRDCPLRESIEQTS